MLNFLRTVFFLTLNRRTKEISGEKNGFFARRRAMINDLRQRRKETRPKPSKNFEKTQRFPFGTTFFFGFLLVGFICVFISIFHRWKTFSIDQQLERNFYSAKIIHLFGKFDRDQNEQLSIDEFEPLALEFLSKHQRHESQLDFQDDDQIVTIDAFFEPLNLSTTNEFSRRRQFTVRISFFLRLTTNFCVFSWILSALNYFHNRFINVIVEWMTEQFDMTCTKC